MTGDGAGPAAAALPSAVPPGPVPVPRPYQQLLRGPRHRWWRPLLSLAVALGCVLGLLWGAFLAAFAVAALRTGLRATLDGPAPMSSQSDEWFVSPPGLLVTNLTLAALIPIAQVAVWAGHRWRPGFVASVAGRVRWRWLLRCYAWSAVVTVPLLVLAALLPPAASWRPEPDALALAAVVLLTTPLQAAGEEYLFRGWIAQSLGSLLRRPLPAALFGGAVSCTLFALAHGEQNLWLFADRFWFGVVATWLAWRTGGLEAGIALHGVNNLGAFGTAIAVGELRQSVEVTGTDAFTFALDAVVLALTAGLLAAVARRRRLPRLFPGEPPVALPPPWPSAAPLPMPWPAAPSPGPALPPAPPFVAPPPAADPWRPPDPGQPPPRGPRTGP